MGRESMGFNKPPGAQKKNTGGPGEVGPPKFGGPRSLAGGRKGDPPRSTLGSGGVWRTGFGPKVVKKWAPGKGGGQRGAWWRAVAVLT
ncbi:hypothetical protein JTE90_001840 [Oedothorax gibbosus]|uniref:Uncharacterized protein n=1 Tax=Oedothorax gibbosus TaxID=931172 RepID=A0AAV6TD26_9ARAC|nr:hypothetical protein JTE90_001840 [Oedothorax gibbosus]